MDLTPKPDLHVKMPAHLYFSTKDYLSSSLLKQVLAGPKAYARFLEFGFKRTKAMDLGSIIHAKLLEPETFDSVIWRFPEGIKAATKAGKEYRAAIEKEQKNKLHCDSSTDKKLDGILHNFPSNAMAALRIGHQELSLFVKCEELGLYKCRFDNIDYDNGIIVDLKTTSNLSAFRWQVKDLNYDLAAYAYRHAAEYYWKRKFRFLWIVVETVEPYEVAWFDVSSNTFFDGEEKYHNARSLLDDYTFLGIKHDLPEPEEI